MHVARRCLLAEPVTNRKRLTVKQLAAAVRELHQLGVLVDSPTHGAVELRSDFGDSRGCDPRLCAHNRQSAPGSPQTEQVGTTTTPPDHVAGSQQSVPVNKYLLQAEQTSSTMQAMQWLTQDRDARSSDCNPLAPDAASGRSGAAGAGGGNDAGAGAGAGVVVGAAGSGGNGAAVLNEYL